MNLTEQSIYFIGIALPEPLNTRISRLHWHLFDNKEPHLLKPLLPHVTLLHPPALRSTMPEELIPKVREIAKKYLPLNIELVQVGFFSEQVCYLQAESPDLYAMQEQFVRLLPSEAQKLQRQWPYRPHVTLAQIEHPYTLNKKQVVDDIHQTLSLPIRFEVTSLTCFRRIFPREYKPENI